MTCRQHHLTALSAGTRTRKRGQVEEGERLSGRPRCPIDPSHGFMLDIRFTPGMGTHWYCPHQTHDGPGGPDTTTTQRIFTDEELGGTK
jgi:hypothetical protein